MAPGINSSADSVRIPRLAYRNLTADAASPDPDEILPVHSTSSSNAKSGQRGPGSAHPVSPTDSSLVQTSTREIDWALQPTAGYGPSGPEVSRQLETGGNPQAQNEKRVGKKSSSLLGFLTVKEPTSSALEQYAKQQKKQAAEKGTKFMAGVSSQKLPANVPKVNSRWDGLPGSAKTKAGETDFGRECGASTTTLYRPPRNSSAADGSAPRSSRETHKSRTSTLDFEFGSTPSLETVSTKSSARHDSGNCCQTDDPIVPLQLHGLHSSVGSPSLDMTGALPPQQSKGNAVAAAGASVVPTKERRSVTNHKQQSTGSTRQALRPAPEHRHDIAPWAEPSDPADSHPSSTASAEAFLAGHGKPEQLEARLIAWSKTPRSPPCSNAEALARLESAEDVRRTGGAAKEGKGKAKRRSGKR